MRILKISLPNGLVIFSAVDEYQAILPSPLRTFGDSLLSSSTAGSPIGVSSENEEDSEAASENDR